MEYVRGPLAILLNYIEGERVVYINDYISIKKTFLINNRHYRPGLQTKNKV